jgi:hypothetical protein
LVSRCPRSRLHAPCSSASTVVSSWLTANSTPTGTKSRREARLMAHRDTRRDALEVDERRRSHRDERAEGSDDGQSHSTVADTTPQPDNKTSCRCSSHTVGYARHAPGATCNCKA